MVLQPGALPTVNPVTGLSNLNTPVLYDPGLGRPPRTSQYNIALQREIIRGLTLEEFRHGLSRQLPDR